jgi:hypothetical protein
MVGSPLWDQNSLASTFSTVTLTPPANDRYLDTGASSHMTSHDGTLSHSSIPRYPSPTSIVVGNGSLLPVTATGSTHLGSLTLNNVLVSPQLIKNLISVRQFTIDNNCFVEFDRYGCSVKDLPSRSVIIRCNSSKPLYPLKLPVAHSLVASSTSASLWHRRLGHPGREALSKLTSAILGCNKSLESLCHACQLGRHVRLPFNPSVSRASNNFDLIHCDLWTSPIVSVSGYKYYLVVLDDCSHHLWTFPLRLKSDTFSTLSNFFAYVSTQFIARIKAVQSDNGREFDNSSMRTFFLTHGIHFRMSCPYTSSQNDRAERIIRTTNDIIRSLLFQASMPPSYWAEALHTATLLLNILPTKTLNFSTPHFALFGSAPSYDNLRVFGCKCYPNLSATAPHKLAPRSALCIFLGYSAHHKGYRCLDPTSNRIIISRHVLFDESAFPFAEHTSTPTAADFNFLDEFPNPAPLPIGLPTMSPAGPPGATTVAARPHAHVQPRPAPPVPTGFPALPRAGGAPSSPTGTPLSAPRAAPTTSPALPHAGTAPSAAPTSPPGFPTPPCAAPALRVYSRRPKPAVVPPAAPATTTAPAPVPRGAVAVPPTVNQHTMTTRAKDGFRVPSLYHAAPLSPIPKTFRGALADPNWQAAMEEEHAALLQNQTWELVPRPQHANIVTGKWIFKHKFHADSSLERYKARWVLRGFTQRPGIDFAETFSPVVKPATVRTVLSLALSRQWPVHQLDVKNAFLHGTLTETVFAAQPSGFEDSARRDFVCRLNKSLYGLKQAPCAWYSRFATHLVSLGFVEAKSDISLFVYRRGTDTTYLLLYVDDIVLTASLTHLLRKVISALQQEFSMKDLGELHHFLGMQVQRSADGMVLSQRQYMVDILDRAGMAECKPCTTPVDTSPKVSATSGAPVPDPSDYRSLAGALQYLTFTRPDIAYAVQHVCLHMHDPLEPHLAALKRILRYIRGTLHLGLHLRPSTQDDLVVYSDADWAGYPDTRKSTSGYAVFLGDNLVSWSSKRQNTVSRSSAEAEYRAVANGVAEASWLRQLLHELHIPLRRATIVYCDNVSAVYMSSNPVQHQRTKHIEIDLHFVREKVAMGAVRVLHVPTTSQFADVFTKGLPSTVFSEFRSSLNVRG